MQITPELLAPAGTYRSMRYAFAYGADAVYAGQPRYSLRVRNNDFTLESLATGIDEAHQQGRTFTWPATSRRTMPRSGASSMTWCR